MSRDQTKAGRYIEELDSARSNGNWESVPELVRKVKKYAPNRACLILTAEAEHAVIQTSHARPGTGRPSTARPTTSSSTSASSNSAVSANIALLADAIEKEKTNTEDRFQAQVCLGWVYWHLGDIKAATEKLPAKIQEEFARLDSKNPGPLNWSKVCALKAAYIKGTAYSRQGLVTEAVETFESSSPILSSTQSSQSGKELKLWTELFLTGFCMSSSAATKVQGLNVSRTDALPAFRLWAKFWDGQGGSPPKGRSLHSDYSRRAVWREYYGILSDILQQDLPFPELPLKTVYDNAPTKLQQRAEIKKVEHRYEQLLLDETAFPKAEDSNEEVEAFVDLVIHNWRVLCGSSWQDEDLGEGGAEGVSRGVLDILYRAATLTFHSTAILRHLFTVHLAVAEFDLAFKAFDTYMDIVQKGKARVDKTGIPEKGLDSDENVLRTASEYIKALCRFGRIEEAEKANDIGKFFEEWLDKHYPAARINGNGRAVGNGHSEPEPAPITAKVFSLAWRSIGIAYAQWARLTFDGASRSDIQLKAIRCLKKALSPEYESTTDVETLFALGTVLAERRELGPAVAVVKTGLLPQSSIDASTGLGLYAGRFARERALIPLWHLLALLLSARQDFVTSARSCEGAFEQFEDPRNLFGTEELGTFRSEHLKGKSAPRNHGVVDDMDDFEKENVLEVKMTQLSLIEVLEGPEVAVNASDELLSLYSRLFGDPQKELSLHLKPTTAALPPKSSSGTIRSLKGSIFGRHSRSLRKSQMGSVAEEQTTTGVSRPQTTQTVASIAPKIQVTNENGSTSRHPHRLKEHPHHHEKLHKKESVTKKKSGGSLRKRSRSANRDPSPPLSPTVVDGETFFTPAIGSSPYEEVRASQVGLAVSPDNDSQAGSSRDTPLPVSHQPLPPDSQQLDHKEPALQPSTSQDTRLPEPSGSFGTSPITRFPKDQQTRRRTSILIKVWLLISGFYRRAILYDDARGAIAEATKLAQGMETDVSKESNSGISVDNSGMGGGKTVNELWGDIFSERGYLAVAESAPWTALEHFESALSNHADHPSATVGLSNILLDVYTEELLPPSSIPKLVLPGIHGTPSTSTLNANASSERAASKSPSASSSNSKTLPYHGPLGLASPSPSKLPSSQPNTQTKPTSDFSFPNSSEDPTPNTSSTTSKKPQLLDRLAARDRAYGLLSNLTKLGSGWNYSEAWFALARAYELGGQEAKAREVLWWCVELEEARGVRNWEDGLGGYVL